MKFGGLQSFTLSDFPGRTAAILFTQGCNFRCPFCHNGELIPLGPNLTPPTEARSEQMPPTEEEILAFLGKRRDLLEGVVVTGGEPTVQPDLVRFLRRIKAMGFAVKLDTNGSRPEMLAEVLAKGLVDYVAMDVKAPLEQYGRLAGVPVHPDTLRESIALIAQSGVAHQFRTTYVEPLLAAADLEAIRAEIPAGSPHKVQAFRPELARDPALRQAAVPVPEAGAA